MLRRPSVQQKLQAARDRVEAKHEVSIDKIIGELKLLAFNRLSKFIKVDENGDLAYDFTGATEEDLAGIEGYEAEVMRLVDGDGEKPPSKIMKYKFKASNRRESLIALLKHLGGQYRAPNAEEPDSSVVVKGGLPDSPS
jgi:hypothetical protein